MVTMGVGLGRQGERWLDGSRFLKMMDSCSKMILENVVGFVEMIYFCWVLN